jgi:hypothetical protein
MLVPGARPRMFALPGLEGVFAACSALSQSANPPGGDLPGLTPLPTVERLAEEAALMGVDTTASEPGEHGMVPVGDERLKLFQPNRQAAPGVIFGADRRGRIDGSPCLTCDQPGGLIQVRGREFLVFCGKIDQRVPEDPARRSTVPPPSPHPSRRGFTLVEEAVAVFAPALAITTSTTSLPRALANLVPERNFLTPSTILQTEMENEGLFPWIKVTNASYQPVLGPVYPTPFYHALDDTPPTAGPEAGTARFGGAKASEHREPGGQCARRPQPTSSAGVWVNSRKGGGRQQRFARADRRQAAPPKTPPEREAG